MILQKSLPPTHSTSLKVELNQEQLLKTTFHSFQSLHAKKNNSKNSLSIFQELYRVKDPYALPSQLSFSYHQALKNTFYPQEELSSEDSSDVSYFKSSISQEEVEATLNQDASNLDASDENLFSLNDPSTPLEEKEQEDQENQEQDQGENVIEKIEDDVSFSNSLNSERDDLEEEGEKNDEKRNDSSVVNLSLHQNGPLSTSTKTVALKFEEDMEGYFLKVKQGQSVQTFPLKNSIQSVSLQEDQALLTLLNSKNEPITSWTLHYALMETEPDQKELPVTQIPIQDVSPLTSTTLIAPLVVDDHTTPFTIPIVQETSNQKELIVDSFYTPIVIENQEEPLDAPSSLSSKSEAFSSVSSSLTTSLDSSSLKEELLANSSLPLTSSTPSLEHLISTPSPISSPTPLPLTSTSSTLVTSNSPLISTQPVTIATPLDSSTTTLSQPSDSISLSFTVPNGLQPPALDQLAYPPSDQVGISSSLNKPEALLEPQKMANNSTSSLLKPLVQELKKQATQPLATVQQSNQILTQGDTLYVKDPNEIQVNVENGILQELKVRSKESRKTYTSLETAMDAEKQATFEMEVNLKSNDSDQISQAKWTIIPLGETIKQSVSLPTQEIEAFYTLENNGTLSSYRKATSPSNAILCRGFEPLENQSVYPGETLRVYVEEEGDYDLSVNGKHQMIPVQRDELGQPYIPISVGSLKTDIALQKDGTMIYTQSLQANNPVIRFGWVAPVLGSLAGIVLDVRRRKWL